MKLPFEKLEDEEHTKHHTGRTIETMFRIATDDMEKRKRSIKSLSFENINKIDKLLSQNTRC